jgi:adenylosuccinate lyase
MAELLVSVGSAAAWLRDCLGRLVVDASRMRANLERSGELVAEPLAAALAPSLGRARAHDVVSDALRTARDGGGGVREALRLALRGERSLAAEQVEALLDVTADVGEAATLVAAALAELHGAAAT